MTERERAQDAGLLPCPFCGSAPILHEKTSNGNCPVDTRPYYVRHATILVGALDTWLAPLPDARDETIRRLREEVSDLRFSLQAQWLEISRRRAEARSRAALKDAP